VLGPLERGAGGALPPIEVVHADCNEYLRGCGAADLVYFDPPWCEAAADEMSAANGGEMSAAADEMSAAADGAAPPRPRRRATLEVGGCPLSTVVSETLRHNSPLVVVKLPPDYSTAQLLPELHGALGAPVQARAYDIHKPRGGLAYRLVFIRAAA
jgi:hypothetical protein